jgi:hypothetical protein
MAGKDITSFILGKKQKQSARKTCKMNVVSGEIIIFAGKRKINNIISMIFRREKILCLHYSIEI